MVEQLLNGVTNLVALLGLILPTALAVIWQTRREATKKAEYHDRINPANGPFQVVWDRSGGFFNARWEVINKHGEFAGMRKVDWFESG